MDKLQKVESNLPPFWAIVSNSWTSTPKVCWIMFFIFKQNRAILDDIFTQKCFYVTVTNKSTFDSSSFSPKKIQMNPLLKSGTVHVVWTVLRLAKTWLTKGYRMRIQHWGNQLPRVSQPDTQHRLIHSQKLLKILEVLEGQLFLHLAMREQWAR